MNTNYPLSDFDMTEYQLGPVSYVDQSYFDIVKRIMLEGEDEQDNRTHIPTRFVIGHYMQLPVHSQFPLLTTKRVFWKAAFAEMIGFIRGYNSAADFRKLGCNVWNKNANENQQWLQNPYRKGEDHLGRIYGVQWRDWNSGTRSIDQLQKVIDDLSRDCDDRREIITAWNPGEIDLMALPPCHMTMVFSLSKQKTRVNLFVLIRSNDVFLGMPFNIAQYAFLLHLVSKMTGKQVGDLHYYANNVHIYHSHFSQIHTQMSRIPTYNVPTLSFHREYDEMNMKQWYEFIMQYAPDEIGKIDQWVSIDNYDPHPPIKAEMAV